MQANALAGYLEGIAIDYAGLAGDVVGPEEAGDKNCQALPNF